MKSTITTTVVVSLELTQDEAEWLHGVMQNPFYEHETKEDAEMREQFWKATALPGI
jgi:hypothetical protein